MSAEEDEQQRRIIEAMMRNEDMVQEMNGIGSTACPALMYRIARQRRGHKHRQRG